MNIDSHPFAWGDLYKSSPRRTPFRPLLASVALTRLLSAVLFGVGLVNPLTFVAAPDRPPPVRRPPGLPAARCGSPQRLGRRGPRGAIPLGRGTRKRRELRGQPNELAGHRAALDNNDGDQTAAEFGTYYPPGRREGQRGCGERGGWQRPPEAAADSCRQRQPLSNPSLVSFPAPNWPARRFATRAALASRLLNVRQSDGACWLVAADRSRRASRPGRSANDRSQWQFPEGR
jgi:hypothetical protein